jgi:hypothetical protein
VVQTQYLAPLLLTAVVVEVIAAALFQMVFPVVLVVGQIGLLLLLALETHRPRLHRKEAMEVLLVELLAVAVAVEGHLRQVVLLHLEITAAMEAQEPLHQSLGQA